MEKFFGDGVLLEGDAAKALYEEVKDLPIIDYHCHLDQRKIAADASFANIGEAWLSGDHYKWRAMRMCGVDEHYITGGASWEEKFMHYAEIVPKLCGGPLYYWTHMELKQIFGIREPLNARTAKDIYARANKKLETLTVRSLLKGFGVEFIATTDDPIDALDAHGTYDGIKVVPSFRPDRLYGLDGEYLGKLGAAAGLEIGTLDDLETAISRRLDFFVSKGCRVADHGFLDFPAAIASREEAATIFAKRASLSKGEKEAFFGYLLTFLLREYKKRDMLAQLHFSVTRNVNSGIYRTVGPDSGCDVIAKEADIYALARLLDAVPEEERANIVLYSLNPSAVPSLAVLSGAFRNVYMGAAWWFNDTLGGIRSNLDAISEYACLGTHLGMLTDSRAFFSYSRFDFFRRILCGTVGGKVDRGEYPLEEAKGLVRDISYGNIKKLLKI